VCALLVYIVLVIVAIVLVLGLVFLTQVSKPVGITLDVVVGLAAFLAVFAFGLLVALALQVSYFTCVIEKQPFITAFARGLSRVFAGPGLRRSLLVALAFIAINLGITFVTGLGQSILYGLAKSNLLGTAYVTLVNVATAAFTTAFLAIYYIDLRVRTEGLDLEVAAGGEPLTVS
jgi:hypothetical protein